MIKGNLNGRNGKQKYTQTSFKRPQSGTMNEWPLSGGCPLDRGSPEISISVYRMCAYPTFILILISLLRIAAAS